MGAIIGALIGRHYGQKWMEESSLVKSAMENIQQAFQPGSTATDDFIDMNMNILRQRPGLKKMMPQIEAGIQRARAYRDAQSQQPQQPAQVAPEAAVTSGQPLPSPGIPPPPPESPELSQFRQMFPVPSIGGGSTGGPVPLTPPDAVIPPQVAQPSQQGGAGFAGTPSTAQAAPTQAQIPQQVAAPAQQGGQGFSGTPSPETFDQLRHVPGQLFNIPPYQVGQRQAAAALPHQEMAMAVRKSLIQEAKDMGLDSVQTADYVTGKGAQWSPLFIEGAKLAMEKQSVKDRIEAMKQPESGGPGKSIWDLLTPRQRAQVQSGDKNITPELRPQNLPGRMLGSKILEGDPDAKDFQGQPLDPKAEHVVRDTAYGKEYVPIVPSKTREILVPDDQSKTKLAKIIVDRYGNEIGRVRDITPPAGYIPRVSVSNGIMQVKQPDGSVQDVPYTSVRTTQPMTGGTPMPTPLPLPSSVTGGTAPSPTTPSAPAIPRASVGPGVQVAPPAANKQTIDFWVGEVRRGATRLDQISTANNLRNRVADVFAASKEQPPIALKPQFQTMVAQIDPVLERIAAIKQQLDPIKEINTSAYFLPQRIQYSLGRDAGTAGLIADLSLSSIQQAAGLLKGSSRAYQIFRKAMDHTPNTWVDSPKMIYNKLNKIETYLRNTKAAAFTEGAISGVSGAQPTQLPAPATTLPYPPSPWSKK
jgi:hypothetical protein